MEVKADTKPEKVLVSDTRSQLIDDYFTETYGTERFHSLFIDASNWAKYIKNDSVPRVYEELMKSQRRIVDQERVLFMDMEHEDIDDIIDAIKSTHETKQAQENEVLKAKLKRFEQLERMIGQIAYQADATIEFIKKTKEM